MAEIPTDSEDEKPVLSIVESNLEKKDPSDITPKDEYEKAMKFMDDMPNLILDKIDKLKTSGVIAENIEYREVREGIINKYAEENPTILNIWDKIKPKETFQEHMENIKQELHKKYDSLTYDELEEPINSNKKSPSMPPLEGNISNINTPKMKVYLEQRKEKREAFLRVRDAMSEHLDEKGLALFNEAMEKEIES